MGESLGDAVEELLGEGTGDKLGVVSGGLDRCSGVNSEGSVELMTFATMQLRKGWKEEMMIFNE